MEDFFYILLSIILFFVIVKITAHYSSEDFSHDLNETSFIDSSCDCEFARLKQYQCSEPVKKVCRELYLKAVCPGWSDFCTKYCEFMEDCSTRDIYQPCQWKEKIKNNLTDMGVGIDIPVFIYDHTDFYKKQKSNWEALSSLDESKNDFDEWNDI